MSFILCDLGMMKMATPEPNKFLAVMHRTGSMLVGDYSFIDTFGCVDEFLQFIVKRREQDRPTWAWLACKESSCIAAAYSKTLGFQDLH